VNCCRDKGETFFPPECSDWNAEVVSMSFDRFRLFGETAFDLFVGWFALAFLVYKIHSDSFLDVENLHAMMVGTIQMLSETTLGK